MTDTREVTRDEAGAILKGATIASAEAAERMTVGELKAAGADVGLTPESIDAALEKEAAGKRAAVELRARRRAQGRILAVGVVAIMGLNLLMAGWNQHVLSDGQSEIAAQRARVQEALARQQRVQALMEPQAESSTRDAELLGSQNRVSVAMRRYDAAVGAYNRASSDCWMPFRSYRVYPQRYPFSQEVSRW